MFSRTIFVILCFVIISVSVSAEVPNLLNYQGYLTDDTGVPIEDGPYLVKFIIYDASVGGTELWNTGFQTIITSDGLFTYQLGSNVPLPTGIFTDTNRFIGITVGTDPELIPRSRIVTGAYAFKTQNADHASNADSLGGLQPSYYRDWSNLINVPSGFNDGIDDEGISLSTAEDNYVSKTGDSMTGLLELPNTAYGVRGLEILGSPTPRIEYYGYSDLLLISFLAGNWAEMLLFDNSGDVTVDLGSNHSAGGFLYLYDPEEGSNSIFLDAGGSYNSSVNLPDSAIDNTEILDEPGLVSNVSGSNVYLTSTMQDLITVTITIPAAGYIKVDGNCYTRFSGTTSGATATYQVDETEGGSHTSPHYAYVGFEGGYSNTGNHVFPIYVSRVYFKSAGTYTFRLEGRTVTDNGTISGTLSRLTAVYYPTSYGTVTTISSDAPQDAGFEMVTSVDIDGSTETRYKYDLRELELKAKDAALKAKEAELELMRVRQQQSMSDK